MPKRYSKNGEWVHFRDGVWQVGLTAWAVDDLGDVTFVESPALGTTFVAGQAACALEAVKAAADYYVPVGGRVVAVNPLVGADPTLLNKAPEETWLFALSDVPAADWDALLDEAAWAQWRG